MSDPDRMKCYGTDCSRGDWQTCGERMNCQELRERKIDVAGVVVILYEHDNSKFFKWELRR